MLSLQDAYKINVLQADCNYPFMCFMFEANRQVSTEFSIEEFGVFNFSPYQSNTTSLNRNIFEY
jgi:hypothetical protein